jgi:hypothetical protein
MVVLVTEVIFYCWQMQIYYEGLAAVAKISRPSPDLASRREKE